jgi:uracil-DNA glycosylase family 4
MTAAAAAPARAIPRPPAPTGQLAQLHREIRRCTACPLYATRRHACPGEGPERAAVMFVGEAPGWEEDRAGRPFVGRAGQLLTELMEAAGITRSRVYVANTVRCLPQKEGGSAEPPQWAVDACRPFLLREIALVRPAVLVAVGRTALRALVSTKLAISEARGRAYVKDGRWVYPIYHPSYLLRNGNDPVLRNTFEEDFAGLRRLLRVHAATLRPRWSLEAIAWLYRSTPVPHAPNAHSQATTWHVLDAFALPQIQGTTVTWDIRGVHEMFRTPSAIQELLRRYVGRPVRLDLTNSSLRRGVRATLLGDTTRESVRPAEPAGGGS